LNKLQTKVKSFPEWLFDDRLYRDVQFPLSEGAWTNEKSPLIPVVKVVSTFTSQSFPQATKVEMTPSRCLFRTDAGSSEFREPQTEFFTNEVIGLLIPGLGADSFLLQTHHKMKTIDFNHRLSSYRPGESAPYRPPRPVTWIALLYGDGVCFL
jgi:hypothetical protein